MWKKILLKIFVMCGNSLFNYLDKNKDGKLSVDEIKLIGPLINKLKNKIKK